MGLIDKAYSLLDSKRNKFIAIGLLLAGMLIIPLFADDYALTVLQNAII